VDDDDDEARERERDMRAISLSAGKKMRKTMTGE